MYHAACKDKYRDRKIIELTCDVFRMILFSCLLAPCKYEFRGSLRSDTGDVFLNIEKSIASSYDDVCCLLVVQS